MKRVIPSVLSAGLLVVPCLVPAAAAEEKKPFHFAHRGGAFEFEENTLFAFRSSYEKGLRGFETDVWMTKDGKLVILHDDSLDRTHRGEGPVEALDAAEAKKSSPASKASLCSFSIASSISWRTNRASTSSSR